MPHAFDSHTIYIIGYMAAGKSQVAKGLGERLGYSFWDTDFYLENRFRQRVSDLFELYGEAFFREKEAMALDELQGSYRAVIATGGGLPCYHDNMPKMLSSGTVIYLQYTLEDLTQRVNLCKRTRPRIAHLEGKALAEKVHADMQLRAPFYEQAHITIPCSRPSQALTSDEVVEEILKALGLYPPHSHPK